MKFNCDLPLLVFDLSFSCELFQFFEAKFFSGVTQINLISLLLSSISMFLALECPLSPGEKLYGLRLWSRPSPPPPPHLWYNIIISLMSSSYLSYCSANLSYSSTNSAITSSAWPFLSWSCAAHVRSKVMLSLGLCTGLTIVNTMRGRWLDERQVAGRGIQVVARIRDGWLDEGRRSWRGRRRSRRPTVIQVHCTNSVQRDTGGSGRGQWTAGLGWLDEW